MFMRRRVILIGLTGLLAAGGAGFAAEPPPAIDPVAIVTAIYKKAGAGKGDGGAGFVYDTKAAKAKYLSKSLIQLWAKADAHTPNDDVGPVDFDPVTNSQDPDVATFKVKQEKLESDRATITATFTGHRVPRKWTEDCTVRYDFVRDGGAWKIDDIKGTVDGQPWSVRTLLTNSLKD